MRLAFNTARAASVAAIVIGISMLLGGCLKFPLGDPEASKVDPALSGVWFQRAEEGRVTLWSVQPFDARTYLVVNYNAKPDPGAGGWERGEMSISKGWLTTVNGQTFITLQVLTEASDTPYVVARVNRTGETVEVLGVSPDFIKDQNVTSAAQMAGLIEKNVDNPKMYLDPTRLEKAGEADMQTVREILEAFH